MVLVFGWMVLGTLYLLSGAQLTSTFRPLLPEAPVIWTAEMSFQGFVLTMSPPLVGLLALWMVPASDWSRSVSITLVILGALLFVGGIVWDAGSGVALYRDKVVHRASGFGQSLEMDRFVDIRRVETSCVLIVRRGSRDPEPSYVLQFANGNRVDIWSGELRRASKSADDHFAIIKTADATAKRAGAVHAPQRKPDGTLIGKAGCISRLADVLLIPPGVLTPVFKVDLSELKPGEYIIAPEGAEAL